MLMLQDNYIGPLGALVVYASVGLQAITTAINGEDIAMALIGQTRM